MKQEHKKNPHYIFVCFAGWLSQGLIASFIATVSWVLPIAHYYEIKKRYKR